MLTLALLALGLLLTAFALGAIVMIRQPIMAGALFIGTGGCVYFAIDHYRKLDRMRILRSLSAGRQEIRARPMELK